MILNLVYGASVNSAPAGFTSGLNAVVSFFQNTFLDAITVNIAVDYGEINSQPLDAQAIARSLTYFNNFNYSQIRSALAADAKSADDASSIASLPLNNPNGGNYWLSSAQAKAVGLQGPSSQLDGYVGFSANPVFDFDNSNGVSPGQNDFFGVVAHEISEVMGRQLLVGQMVGGGPGYDALDLFNFSAPGVHDFLDDRSGYFSIDNGATNLNNFNNDPSGDAGDWASSAGNDAYLAFIATGTVNVVSATDGRVMDVLGWDTVATPPPDTTPPSLLSSRPADNETGVAPTSDLVLSFSENVRVGAGRVLIRKWSDNSTVANIAIGDTTQISFFGTSVIVNPAADLAANTHYYATVDPGAVLDIAGNPYPGISSNIGLDFTTGNARTAPYDFNADGRSDVLLQNNSGQAAVWLMDGSSVIANASVGSNPGPSWHVMGTGDFNGDGRADVLWQNDNGQAAIWTMNGTIQTSSVSVGANPGPAWHVKGAGDFNGDGKPDILWQNTDGTPVVWLMNGTTQMLGSVVGTNPGPTWHVKGARDFSGDGKADILWQNDDGQAAIWTMNGTTQTGGVLVGSNPGPSWHVDGVGDFNADGNADILWQNDNGQAAIWLMNGTTRTFGSAVGNADPSWHIEAAGDYNGDGKSDIIGQNDNGQATVWLMDGTAVLSATTVGYNPGPSWHIIGWATADTSPPVLLSAGPADNATNVAPTSDLVLNFSENVRAGSGSIVIHQSSDGSIIASIAIDDTTQIGFSASSVVVNPTADLAAGTHYYVTLDPGAVRDVVGNVFAGISSSTGLDFTTGNARAAPYDFNADGKSDVLLQNNSGQAAVWLIDDSNVIANIAVGSNLGPSWHAIGAGDFNGDGRADLLWQNDSGQAGIWTMNGTIQTSGVSVGTNPGPSWHVKGAGDFDGDGKADILWQNTDGTAGVWLMNGTTQTFGSVVGSNPGPTWHVKGAGDFDGDGKADILWQNDNGQAAIWTMNGTTQTSGVLVGSNPGPAWHIETVGDFNADGKADILWQNDNGQAAIWLMNGTTIINGATVGPNSGPSWHVEAAGDYNGDGKSDILWQNDNGQAAAWLMDGTAVVSATTVGDNLGPSWHVDWA